MAVETTLYSLLSTATAITAVTGTRIYPVVAPPKVKYPYVVYSRISGGQENGLDGYLTLENPRIQIDVHSTSYSEVKAVAKSIHTAIDGATTFKGILLSDLDLYGDELEEFRVSMDFSLFNRE